MPAKILVVNGKVIFMDVKKMCRKSFAFLSTYCCEQGFSAMCMMKNKFCARLSVKHDLCVCLSKTLPRIDLRVKQSQAHPSHQIYKEMIKVVKRYFFAICIFNRIHFLLNSF